METSGGESERRSESPEKKGKGSNPNSWRALQRYNEQVASGEAGRSGRRELLEEVEDELEAMKWVMGHSEDRTYQQRGMRQWLKDNPGEFRRVWAGLKRASLTKSTSAGLVVGGCASGPVPGSSSDPGLGRLKGLLPDWHLMEWLFEHYPELLEWAVSRGYRMPGE